jgi:glutamyl/glutaminyl-tRNA synthetase
LIDAGLINFDGKKYKISKANEEVSEEKLQKIIKLEQERIKKLSEISELTSFFFDDAPAYEKDILRWKNMPNEDLQGILKILENAILKIDENNFKKENLEKVLFEESEKIGDKGKIFWPFRALLSGKKASPSPSEIAEILGKEKTLKRIKIAMEK